LDDFHGTSDIVKIATTCIIIGKPHEVAYSGVKPNGYPTFIRVVKHRLDGSRTWPTSINFFQPQTGTYAAEYAIGHLTAHDTKWDPLIPVPAWAKSASVSLIGAT
jgi:hypothetical protein